MRDMNQFGEGFGSATQLELEELRKALSAGYALSGQQGGAALRVQSLEASLKIITYTQDHFKFWRDIAKLPAYSTAEEYNELDSYGGEDNGFVPEGELPEEEDSVYVRRASLVKFLGTTRKVTHPMTLVKTAHGDVITRENENGILWLLRIAERSLFTGNSGLVFSGEGLSWDGLDSLVDPASVIDRVGLRMNQDTWEEAADKIVQAFGYPDTSYLTTTGMQDFVKELYPRERFNQPQPTQDGQVGFAVKSMSTQGGVIRFRPNVFLRSTPVAPTAASSPKAPDAPASIAAGATSGTAGQFGKAADGSDAAGDYSYSATFGNRFGESAETVISAPKTIVSGDIGNGVSGGGKSVPLTITNPSAITRVADFVNIYRSKKGGSIRYLIAKIPIGSQSGSGTTSFLDSNVVLPDTSVAYVGENTTRVIAFKQLAPLMKMDLAILSPAYRWMVLLYGVMQLYAPKKWVRIINVGRTPNP